MSSEIPTDKAGLRQWARTRRATLDMPALSRLLIKRLAALPEFHAAQSVLLYLAMPGEVSVEEVCALPEAAGKTWHVPRCAPDRRLAVHAYEPGETPLRSGPFGIREPDPAVVPETAGSALDLVVVPALLLSRLGERLGYGGGYYDRFLPRLRPDCALVGVFPSALVLPTLPQDPWDHKLTTVLTETDTFRPAV